MRRGWQPDERGDDLARLGVDAAQAQAWLAAQDGDDEPEDGAAGDEQPGEPLQVWPENWLALQAWLRLQTQWHLAPSGQLVGLRHDAAEAMVARLMRDASQAERDRVMLHLVDMEQAAVEALDG